MATIKDGGKSDPAQSQKDEQKTLKIFEAILFGLFCGLSAGYLLGRARSPKFDDPTVSPLVIRRYVRDKCRFERVPNSWSMDMVESKADCVVARNRYGAITSIGPVVTYCFSCGVVTYAYNPKTKQIQKRAFHPATDTDYSHPPRNGFKFSETFALMVGGAGGYSLKEAGSRLLNSVDTAKESNDPLKMIFYTCLGAISGVLWGFWLGYVKDPKCGEPLFQQLLNDVVFWEGLAEEYRGTKWWRFFQTPQGIHVLTGPMPLPSVSGPNASLSPLFEPESSATRFSEDVIAYFTSLIEPTDRSILFLELYGTSSQEVFEKPSRALIGVLKVLGEDALITKLEAQVGKNNGIDWQVLRQTN